MSRTTSVIVFDAAADAFRGCELAGRPAGDYLLDALRACDGVTVLAAPGQAASAAHDPAADVLIVDACAWLPPAALATLLSHARGRACRTRVVKARPRPAGESVAVLAVYLPAAVAADGFDPREELGGSSRMGDFVVEGGMLDPTQPAALLDSFNEVAECERRLLLARAEGAMADGVRVRDPRTLYLRGELSCGSGVEIDVNVLIEGRVVLGDGVVVGANSVIRNAEVGAGTRIQPFSLIEGSTVGARSLIGPYGRLRPGATLGEGVQIGNFVEVKNSTIGAGSRINHHTFIGDATLADGVTIGAGTITCNHDGVSTVETIVRENAYVGSGSVLVAPVEVGEGATIAAGSTITDDVPPGTLTLARARQTTVENWRGPRRKRR